MAYRYSRIVGFKEFDMAQSAGLREPAKEEAQRYRATNPRTRIGRTTKFRRGSFKTQEGNRIAQGIVNQEKHEDNKVVSKQRRKVQVIV